MEWLYGYRLVVSVSVVDSAVEGEPGLPLPSIVREDLTAYQ